MRGKATVAWSLSRPTLMMGAAMVFATVVAGVSAFGDRWDAGTMGCWDGGGVVAHAVNRITMTARRFMTRGYAKTRASRATPSRIRASGSLAKVRRMVLRPLPSTKNGAPGT